MFVFKYFSLVWRHFVAGPRGGSMGRIRSGWSEPMRSAGQTFWGNVGIWFPAAGLTLDICTRSALGVGSEGILERQALCTGLLHCPEFVRASTTGPSPAPAHHRWTAGNLHPEQSHSTQNLWPWRAQGQSAQRVLHSTKRSLHQDVSVPSGFWLYSKTVEGI